jgi:uncharacterized protein YggU (UPF0235/DUF167 family)
MFIKVKVFPGQKKDKIEETKKNSFSLRVKEKAEQGRAHQKVTEMLAKFFNVSKPQIRLVKGAKTRSKIFDILN